jgi:sugar lactone lactonase YvrE
MTRLPLLMLACAAAATACSPSGHSTTGPAPTGTVSGTVTSSLGGGLARVAVIVTPTGEGTLPADSTTRSGAYTAPGVPIGSGSGAVTVANIPNGCTAPTPAPYSGLTAGATATANIVVTCTALPGSLTITVTAPAAVPTATIAVLVNGPNNYSTTITQTTTLTGLVVGTYTLAASSTSVGGPVVSAMYVGTPSHGTVTVGGGTNATDTVQYVLRGGSGGLWLGNQNPGSLVEFQPGSSSAVATITSSPGIVPEAIAFDAQGNMWIADWSGGTSAIMEFTPAQMAAGGSQTPAITITGSGLSVPNGLAFDGSGNLWVANVGNYTIVEFSASQLATSGTPTPAVTLSSANGFGEPVGLAFDAAANLWVAWASGVVAAYTPTELIFGGAVSPSVSFSVSSPVGLAFDPSGNLWVTRGSSDLVAYTPANQAIGGGQPTYGFALAGQASAVGIAFDNSGDAWLGVLTASGSAVYEYTPGQLVSGQSVSTPKVTIASSALATPFAIAFSPHAPNLPLQ